MTAGFPTGTVTFLFTDIEGSTRLLQELGHGYAEVLAEHHRVLREVWARHDGMEMDTAGDAFFVAFTRASDACEAALAAQRALEGGPASVRMGLHTGEPLLNETGYVGIDVHRAARIADVAHGGQIVISRATYDLVGREAVDLGEHRLKDLAAPERLYQLGAGKFPALRSLHRTNLPIQSTQMIGRADELERVLASLRRGRLVTVTGPGGAGKTRLALQAAAEAAEDYPDGVWWISLAAVTDPALVLPTLASAIGAAGELTVHIGAKRLLLLVDNLEQVIDAASGLAEILASTSNAKLLATSRQPLRIAGETEIDIPPLADADGVALFLERARAVDPTIGPSEDVGRICARFDGLPLAIELAAARVRVLSPAAMLARLDHRLPLLTGDRRDVPERQRTLRATITWTYDLLDDAERATFARLGVFHGGWSLVAAEQVTGTELEVLESLIEKSFVRRQGDRYFMLETIREYAAELLGDAGDLMLRHAEWYWRLVERLDPELRGAGQQAAYSALRADVDNIRAALAFARAAGQPELEAALAGACWYFWMYGCAFSEGRRHLAAAAEATDVSPLVRARVLEGLSGMESSLGNHGVAVRSGAEALRMRRQIGEPTGILRSLINTAAAYERSGLMVESMSLLTEVSELAARTGDVWFETLALTNLGSSALGEGDGRRAEILLRAALELESSDAFTRLAARVNLAAALLVQGQREEALRAYRDAALICARLEAVEFKIWCLEGLAVAASSTDVEAAARIGGASARACEELDYALSGAELRFHDAWSSAVTRLAPERRLQLEAEGRALGLDEALEYALASVH